MRVTATAAILASGILMIACASQPPAEQMISSTLGSTVVRRAEVTGVRDVIVQNTQSSSSGSAGEMTGPSAEQADDTTHATEVTVRFDNGDIRSYRITTEEVFQIGDMVTVSSGYGGTHIRHK